MEWLDIIMLLWGVIMLPYIVRLPRDKFFALINYDRGFLVATILAVLSFFVLPVQCGRMARDQISHLPWDQVHESYVKWGVHNWWDGLTNGFGALVHFLAYFLWIFVIPGHILSMILQRELAKRPIYPYVIGALFGLLVYTFNKQLYDLSYYIRF